MTVRTQRFAAAGPAPALEVRNFAGSVTVDGREDASEVTVEVEPLDSAAEGQLDRVEVSASESRIRVSAPERRLWRSPSFAVRIVAPAGIDARVETASASADLRGRLGRVRLTTASGDASVEACASLKVRTASGDTRADSVDGRATVGAASGDVRIGRVGTGVDVRTASGDVSVDESTGDVAVGTASGDVSIGTVHSGAVKVRTASGDVEIGVVPGQRVWLELSSVSGRMDSQLAGEDPEDMAGADEPAAVTLSLKSMSGDLRIRRAATAE